MEGKHGLKKNGVRGWEKKNWLLYAGVGVAQRVTANIKEYGQTSDQGIVDIDGLECG